MAVHQTNKTHRTARWERKQKHNVQDKRIRKVLKDRKKQRKLDRGVNQIVRHAPGKRTNNAYVAAVESLWQAVRKLKMVKSDRIDRPGYYASDNVYLYALAQMAERHEMWLRDPVDFHPRTYNVERQFTELARHLFTNYAPPACFEQAWFERNKRKARRYQKWYIQTGRGESPRRLANMPFEMTRRTAHLLVKAPATLTIEQALRWTQVRAMGARPVVADALLASPIGTDFKRDEFWLTVVRFLIDQPMLDPAQVGPMVDYIDNQRHEPVIQGDGRMAPAQPNFSMKGRSVDRLLRQVQQWHGRLAAQSHHGAFVRWEPSGIPGKMWIEGTGKSEKHLAIRELVDSGALQSEGMRMNHCVGSYAHSCKLGHVAIFSMVSNATPLLTIEVRLHNRTIVQARGKCNREAKADELRNLRTWAQQADLQIANWL
jgi:hypothetical protein